MVTSDRGHGSRDGADGAVGAAGAPGAVGPAGPGGKTGATGASGQALTRRQAVLLVLFVAVALFVVAIIVADLHADVADLRERFNAPATSAPPR